MKKFIVAGTAAALFAIPAAANAQAYVQVETGLDSISVDGESDEGVAYGVSAGYDLPISGGMFVGIQGTAADSTVKECASDVEVEGDRLCAKTGRDLSAVVRLGTSVGAKSKLYVLAGYTNARLRVTYDDGETFSAASANADGVRLGAGFQYDLSDSLFVKAEYRYSNYEADFSRNDGIIALGMKF
ncbi:outer membrane immunogenic protein [Novosphingobium sp. CF614]|uniref:outer membrane protein n=1 Tax=Novosphingobium sp. CF614 TaxID=1884364 RepID=UPI0008EF4901|nr:outer membrane beta-barrel protein [Novosphingobium sp. CF614]SFG05039.1 outer membrane immunogenic protein [Novosphingobium sp. CF614]